MSVFLVFTSGCDKDDDIPASDNPTNGKTTAVFNPAVSYGTVIDQDGNKYKTVTIGKQTWMAENLRTTIYNDGTAIPNITADNEWVALASDAYCNYNNTISIDSIATFGRIYNWYAVNTGKLAPTGWHVATDTDWTELTNYLGGPIVAGSKLKEIGTTHWISPNNNATNQIGFTALPGGYRYNVGNFCNHGAFCNQGYNGFWWSATESNATNAWHRNISHANSGIDRSGGSSKVLGFSVRCVKD